ncbi:MAG: helix-turn-helix domain-containing protein [Clostridia bacterium]|nr:helix-turn-helix domain-containing protein [Clostridia bacterium]
MEFHINRTQDGVIKYPLHKHIFYEIMFYVRGKGCLQTEIGNYPFSPGTIIIVPPGVSHGSASESGFCNICVGGDFDRILRTDGIVTFFDKNGEAKMLAEMIYNNRFGNKEYLSALCGAYLRLLLSEAGGENRLNAEINRIIYKISENYYDSEADTEKYLKESGYAPDYIRAAFKKATGKTPSAFLADIRIRQACYLTDIYADSLQMQEIAEKCGYIDYAYFSKKFRSVMKMSPTKYKKMTKESTGMKEILNI